MKTKILLIIVLFTSNFITSQEFDVRRANWGMTMDEVKNSEKPLIATTEDNNEIVYENVFLNDRVKSIITYTFSNGRLIKVRYIVLGPDDINSRGTCENIIPLQKKIITTKFIFDALVAKQMRNDEHFGWSIRGNSEKNEILKKGKYDSETINLLNSELKRLNRDEVNITYFNKRSSANITIMECSANQKGWFDCNHYYYNTYMWLTFKPRFEVEEELRKRNF